MQLQKTDDEQEMEMNMTPMIDVVFLLIIFFMVITDLTQQDLEELKLPTAQNAQPDKPKPDEFRPVVNIKQDGSIWVKRKAIYDPENPDDYKMVREYLSDVAKMMEREKFDGTPTTRNDPNSIPGEALLVRADQFSAFKHTQKVMEQCGYKGIQIWKLQLAASESEKDKNE
jgi:biopolymer transport protein ExbD